GDRSTLSDFLADCTNAFELAHEDQSEPFSRPLSQNSKPAKASLAAYSFHSWNELKEKLKLHYQDRQHEVTLMEELANCRQLPSESVTQYYTRIEQLVAKLITAAVQNNIDPSLIPGKISCIKENALNGLYTTFSPRFRLS
ncbi:hypothetical protein U1Q18_051904, partial [Sarracenia purpurea var. burkii]